MENATISELGNMTAEQLGQFIDRINDAKTWHELGGLEIALLDEHGNGESFDESDDEVWTVRQLIYARKKEFKPRNGEKYIYRQGGWESPYGEVKDGEIVQVEDQPHDRRAADNDTYCYVVSEDGSRFIGNVYFSQLYPIPEKDTTT